MDAINKFVTDLFALFNKIVDEIFALIAKINNNTADEEETTAQA